MASPDSRGSPAPRVNERIVREIERRIARGELKADDRLPSERDLARQYRLSRASVREALRALERSGLIVARHGDGNFVARPAPGPSGLPLVHYLDRERQRMLDLSEVRQMLEPRLAAVAAERATDEDLARMHAALDDELRHLRSGDVEAGFVADRAFHVAVAEATHSSTFAMLHNHLSDLVAGSRREAVYHDSRRVPSRHVDHKAIYQAISRRQPAAAWAAMLQHLERVEGILLGAVRAYKGLIAGPRSRARRRS